MSAQQQRTIDLQKALSIARKALERIKHGARYPEDIAEAALDEMWPLEKKQQLQGLVGHVRRGAKVEGE